MNDRPINSKLLRSWTFSGTVWEPAAVPRLMGIVNVTPDSFSDGGQWFSIDAAVQHALQLVADGADVLDVGGESTRPNADSVSLSEELKRVVPVIESLSRQTNVPISIDTTKSEVAQAALQAGARIVNDISGLTFEEKMVDVCAASDCGVILMHIQGTPKTMQLNPHYENAVVEIRDWLKTRCEQLQEAGIESERLMVDPGIGFGKTAQHNLEILTHIHEFQSFGRPVLIGHSRKGFLKKLIGREVDERLAGTIGVSIALAQKNVDLLRVHDVRAVRDAITAWQQLCP